MPKRRRRRGRAPRSGRVGSSRVGCRESTESSVESRVESKKKVVQNLMFFVPQILWEGPRNCVAFVNRHHFRPTGQVWFKLHGWSFIYADEIKNKQVAQLSLTNPHYALHHGKRQNLKMSRDHTHNHAYLLWYVMSSCC